MIFFYRFKVTREDVKKDTSTPLEHMHYVDVPASGTKDFKIAMYFYKEGVTQMKVEHLFIKLHFSGNIRMHMFIK